LEKAVREKKISDTHCTGLTYSEILALSLGFEGGTTNKMISLEIGSNTYIAGFESGLVGYVPAEAGEENPVRLELTFPSNYGNADLAGQDVIFFCKLVYIGNKSAGAYTADTISVELVNEIMGMSAEKAYKSLDECFARIREGMEQERDIALRNAKATAIFNEFLKRATIPTVPDEMLTAYIDSVLSSYLNQMVDMYNNNPMYYSYYFGTAKPSEKVVAAYLGYKTDDYREKMKADVTSAVKQEMIFWYYVQIEEITLSEQEIADMREKYIKLYGASVFEGLSDSVIKEQFIRDKFVDGQIAYMEEKNNKTEPM
jgi:trigger factor